MNDESWTIGGIIGAVSTLFGGVIVQQRAVIKDQRDELTSERKDCREAIKELREQQRQADKQQRETIGLVIDLAERLGAGEVVSQARSISPPRPFHAVKENDE